MTPQGEGWQPIETADKSRTICAAIWHGSYQFIVQAKWRSRAKAWIDIAPHSSVGWTEGVSRQAYWFDLPTPPTEGA